MKAKAIICVILSVFTLGSCSFFGDDDGIVPVIAEHTCSKAEQSYAPVFARLNKCPTYSDKWEDEETTGSTNPEEPSAEPQPGSFEYKGFEVEGISQSDVLATLDLLLEEINKADATNVSIAYKSLTTDASFFYNSDYVYKAGSLTRAPYVKYLLSTDISLDDTLTLTEKQKNAGGSKFKNSTVGDSFLLRDVFEYTIKDSDSTAFKMLYDNFGFSGFNKYAATLGVNTIMSGSDIYGNITASETCSFFEDIYYSFKQNDKCVVLVSSMVNATYDYLIPSGIQNVDIAHKFGYMSGSYKVLHDAGIVYTNEPYILVILTDFNPSDGNGRSTFTQLSSIINAFHTK